MPARRTARSGPPPAPLRRPEPRRSARDTVLAEWRGTDWSPVETAHRLAARSTAQLVPAVVQLLNLDQRRAETEICKAWKTLIDPALAAHARPTGLRRGTLFVSVDSSVWLAEIVRYRQREILERLHSAFGTALIRKIAFRVG
ncbi:MAG TPA: DUF721 domain-containing protein [Verrucomicrobiota bacterium]|nr:DUF721 domain-containing protein [Verrucomicrobiota bacterium]HRZ38542.1 DUF721 domain-containing protein [Candidatus Paceibacterota bacterium]